ncbi:MAG: T9SS type A sorting domain-containing protein, partial [Bacteroidaceae bacterium]|nr:T9SS type A sorting domain-containing protein [Bacteroidaceae bacterium]
NGGEIIANENSYLDLYAYVYPYYATYQGVNWVVEDGSELATIDSYGRLTATGKGDGKVVVRAYALDGSGVYAETAVMLDGFVAAGIDSPCQEEGMSVCILQSGNLLKVSASVGSQVAIYDLSGRQVSVSVQESEVSYYRIAEKGFYILRVGGYGYKFVCH